MLMIIICRALVKDKTEEWLPFQSPKRAHTQECLELSQETLEPRDKPGTSFSVVDNLK